VRNYIRIDELHKTKVAKKRKARKWYREAEKGRQNALVLTEPAWSIAGY
jgi:hypothetical protein